MVEPGTVGREEQGVSVQWIRSATARRSGGGWWWQLHNSVSVLGDCEMYTQR